MKPAPDMKNIVIECIGFITVWDIWHLIKVKDPGKQFEFTIGHCSLYLKPLYIAVVAKSGPIGYKYKMTGI